MVQIAPRTQVHSSSPRLVSADYPRRGRGTPRARADWMHHHIGSTHVCHHLFSNLPCYHAVEATKHLKAYLKPLGLYNYDHDPVVTSMWKAAKECQYVEGTDGIHFPKAVRDLKKD